MEKRKEPFRFSTGFKFGMGFMIAAYSVMFVADRVGELIDILFIAIRAGV